jgi:hypothetical protein
MNDKDIALKISEILGCRYSHHDLHYVDYELGGKHSLLTSYQGISPFTPFQYWKMVEFGLQQDFS